MYIKSLYSLLVVRVIGFQFLHPRFASGKKSVQSLRDHSTTRSPSIFHKWTHNTDWISHGVILFELVSPLPGVEWFFPNRCCFPCLSFILTKERKKNKMLKNLKNLTFMVVLPFNWSIFQVHHPLYSRSIPPRSSSRVTSINLHYFCLNKENNHRRITKRNTCSDSDSPRTT